MLSPRWRKVLADLWANKVRTLLVVSSIAVGVFAVGLVAGSNELLSRELTRSHLATNPASAELYPDPFDEELVHIVRRIPGVREAEGRRTVRVRAHVSEKEWRDLTLFVIPDFDDIRINRIWPQAGKWGPARREVILERTSVGALQTDIGGTLRVETPDGRQRDLRVAGIVHDPNQLPTLLSGTAYGYISFETLEWLGWDRGLNELKIVVDGTPEELRDREFVRRIAEEVAAKIERGGRTVHWTWIPTPGKHPADEVIAPVLGILGVLGLLSLAMSGFLVVNTLAATLTQHVRQIGVMKAIGARTHQLASMYLGMVLVLSTCALLVAIPLAWLGARLVTAFMAGVLNFDVTNYDVGAGVLLLEAAVGLLVPLLAALYPVISGTRRTVREAISAQGAGAGAFGRSWVDRMIERLRGLSRPLLLSLRNTFRRKGRLAMTLVTLTRGGVMFIAVMSVHQSLLLTLDDALRYWNFDISVGFGREYRRERVEREALKVPGVTAIESWGAGSTRLQRADGTESENYMIIAPPAGSRMIQPDIVAGRWLLPADENAVVINTDILREEPGLKVGDVVTLKIDGRESDWQIVGIARSPFSSPTFYTSLEYFERVIRRVGRASEIRVLTTAGTSAELARTADALKEYLEAAGINVAGTLTIDQVREPVIYQFNILVAFLLIMATLLAVVGALGLAGTMSINVLERIREIGVMRAIGASSRAVMRLVIVEGVLIGLISWILGGLLSVPLSRLLCDIVGVAIMQMPLSYTFSSSGLLAWLAIVLTLAAAASLLPAWNAARLTVRDVLAYE